MKPESHNCAEVVEEFEEELEGEVHHINKKNLSFWKKIGAERDRHNVRTKAVG